MKKLFLILLFFSCTVLLLQAMDEDYKSTASNRYEEISTDEEGYNSQQEAALDSAKDYGAVVSDNYDNDPFVGPAPLTPVSNLKSFKTASQKYPKATRFILVEDEEQILFLQSANAKEVPDENEEEENRNVVGLLVKKLLENYPSLNVKEFLGEALLNGKIPLSSAILRSIFNELDSRKFFSQQNQHYFMSDRISSSSSSSAAREIPDADFFDGIHRGNNKREDSRALFPSSFNGHHVEIAASRIKRARDPDSPVPLYGIDELITQSEKLSTTERRKIAKFKKNLSELRSTDTSAIPWDGDQEEGELYENLLILRDSINSLKPKKIYKKSGIVAATNAAKRYYMVLRRQGETKNEISKKLFLQIYFDLKNCSSTVSKILFEQAAQIRNQLLEKYDKEHQARADACAATLTKSSSSATSQEPLRRVSASSASSLPAASFERSLMSEKNLSTKASETTISTQEHAEYTAIRFAAKQAAQEAFKKYTPQGIDFSNKISTSYRVAYNTLMDHGWTRKGAFQLAEEIAQEILKEHKATKNAAK